MSEAEVPEPPFTMGKHHKKALVVLLHCFHNNRQSLGYLELSRRIDVGEKTKAWQCGAWRDLKNDGYIVPSTERNKEWELSEDLGVPLASTLVSAEELAEYVPPDTSAKLHEQIKKRLHKLPRGARVLPRWERRFWI